jgi:hypothetical protein
MVVEAGKKALANECPEKGSVQQALQPGWRNPLCEILQRRLPAFCYVVNGRFPSLVYAEAIHPVPVNRP